MRLTILLFCLLIIGVSCTPEGEQKTQEPASTKAVDEKQELTPVVTLEEMGISTMLRAEYLSATVYAGATDYAFLLDDGQTILIRVSHEEGAENPIMPPGMLESGSDIEGPPGANPKLVGKFFTVEKDPSGKYVKVIYSTGTIK